jgi:hypothetical protein
MKRTCSIIVALAISLFIYLFYRSEKTVVNEFAILILSQQTYGSLKHSIMTALPLNKVIVFSLPGGLWTFCVTLLSQGFYLMVKERKIQLVLVPVAFGICLELCQLIHLTNGRFDLWDIVFYLMFWLLAFFSFDSQKTQQNILSPFTLHGFICVACFLSVYLAHVSQ